MDPIARRRAKRDAIRRRNLLIAAAATAGMVLCAVLVLVAATLARHHGRGGVSLIGPSGDKWDMADLRIYLRDHGVNVGWYNTDWTPCPALPGRSAFLTWPKRSDQSPFASPPYVLVQMMESADDARKKENIAGGWAWGKFYFRHGHNPPAEDNPRSVELMEQIKKALD